MLSRWMQAGLLLTLLALLAGGLWLHRVQAEAMRFEVERELTAIARLKAHQISEWRADQLEDAATLSQDPYLLTAISTFLAAPTAEHRSDLRGRFATLARQHDIEDILLVDQAARVQLRLGGLSGHPEQWYQPAVHTALAGRRPVFVDLHRGPLSDIPHSSTVTPLFDDAGRGRQPLGCLVLVNGDSRFLFPLLQVWPTSSRSAETLLVRRDGEEVLFLAGTRHQGDAALNLRLPLADNGPVSVQAVQGRTGYVHGRDYRGVEVAAVLLPIVDTPWLMVAKIDRDEAFAGWRLHSRLLLALLAALAALVAIGGLVLWQRQEKTHYRALYQAEAATRAALEHRGIILEAVGDGVIAVDVEGRVDLLNPAAVAFTGWTGEAARGHLVEEVVNLVDSVTGAPLPNPARTALTTGGPATPVDDQALLVARGGDRFQVAVAATPLPAGDGAVLAIRDMTQSSRLRQTMRHERRILKLFVDHAPAAIAMFDAQLRFLAVSRRFLADHRLEGHDLIGQGHEQVFPDLPEWWRAACRRCLQGAVEHCTEEQFQHADGRTEWVRWAMHPWYEVGGEVGGLVLFSEVITARKEAEFALEASRRQLAHLFAASPAVIFALQADTLAPTWVSPNVVDLLGYTVAEVLEPDWWVDHMHAGDRQRVLANLTTLADRDRITHEYRFHRRDGSLLWVHDDLRLVRDEHGRPTEIIGAWTDITHRREAEAALQRSEAKFRTLFQRHAAVKLLLDADDGRIIEANEAAVAFYGWSRQELERMRMDQINTLPPHQVRAELSRVRNQERIYFEFRHRRADGSIRDVAVYSSAMELEGRPVIHSIVHDITEFRQLEEQLRQAQKMESIGRLAGGVAHDFNNMLAVILGYTQLVLDRTPVDDPRHEDLEEVLHAAEHSAGITRQLLAFARQQPISPEVLDLNAAVDGLLKMLGRLIGDGVRLVWRPGAEVLPVVLDPAQFDQILANLCVNARDAVGASGTITIETGRVCYTADDCANRPERLAGDFAVLTVRDDGCGMDRVTRERIFEPFFTTKPMGEGTGLGLAMVYGTVHQNRGFIEVESAPGEGTVFRIHLPHHTGATAAATGDSTTAAPMGRGETVLVVEDDPLLLGLVRQMLGKLGYAVHEADTPAAALALAAHHDGDLDVVLTDVVLPEMDGRDLADRIRALRPSIRVVFMSGYAPGMLTDRGVLAQGAAFLQKPFPLHQLARRLRQVLDPADTPS